jgi:hypothetical protein
VSLVAGKANGLSYLNKRKKGTDNQDCAIAKEELDAPRHENILEVQSQQLFPIEAPHPICLICIGNEEFSDEQRMRCISQKNILKKHVEMHFRLAGLHSCYTGLRYTALS